MRNLNLLESTPEKTNGNKSYFVTHHGLRTLNYCLTMTCIPYPGGCSSPKAVKFESLEAAQEIGDEFLKSDFEGLFAASDFMDTV